jgi:hypothetical protein
VCVREYTCFGITVGIEVLGVNAGTVVWILNPDYAGEERVRHAVLCARMAHIIRGA